MSNFSVPLSPVLIEKLVANALSEDMPSGQDVTSWTMLGENAQMHAQIIARKDGVLAGIALAKSAFLQMDPALHVDGSIADGTPIKQGQSVLSIRGSARAIVSGERAALNFLGMMSGTASLTNKFVQKAKNTKARIVCTRKTLPGLRAVQKYAVLAGGGVNHRYSLSDGVLVKDNHIAAMGSITNAILAARAKLGHMIKIEIEIDTLCQLDEALAGGADVVLLDNMNPEQLAKAVKRTGGAIPLEASGGVTLNTITQIAQSGVDYISIGALTHSAPNFDFGLDVK